MQLRLAVITVLLACSAQAHEGEPLQPHDLWSAWDLAPSILIPLILTAILYYRGARPERGFTTRERACFWAGWVTLALSLVSPLHPLGEALFSAHMVQHELLMVVAAPLLVLGRPLVASLWAFPIGPRRQLGGLSRTFHNAAAAWIVHAFALWGWHFPVLFQATLDSSFIHSLQHISFLGSAIIFWWALFHDRLRGRNYGIAVLYLFTTAIHTSILGALLTFSNVIWYPAYSARTAAWGLTQLEDQQLGGLIMWVPAGLTYIIAGAWLMARWIRQSDIRAAVALIAACAFIFSSCGFEAKAKASAAITGGNPWAGKNKIAYYGCGSCHTIPGISGADGLVGPPLTKVASRVYVAGVLPNTPGNMSTWIQNPRGVDDKTAMPNLGVNAKDAQDIVAYLYTLK